LLKQSLGNPKAQLGKFTNFVKSKCAITAASALIITPSVLGIVDQVTAGRNLPTTNVTVILIAAAIVLFIIAGMIGEGIIQNILLGGVIGLVVNALLTVPQIGNAVSRVSRSRSG